MLKAFIVCNIIIILNPNPDFSKWMSSGNIIHTIETVDYEARIAQEDTLIQGLVFLPRSFRV